LSTKNFDCKKCWNQDPETGNCRLFSVVPVYNTCAGYRPKSITAQLQEEPSTLLPLIRRRAAELNEMHDEVSANEWISAILYEVKENPLAKRGQRSSSPSRQLDSLKRFIRDWEPEIEDPENPNKK